MKWIYSNANLGDGVYKRLKHVPFKENLCVRVLESFLFDKTNLPLDLLPSGMIILLLNSLHRFKVFAENALKIPIHIPEKERQRYSEFLKAYSQADGNVSKISRILNVSRPTVYAWQKKFGIA